MLIVSDELRKAEIDPLVTEQHCFNCKGYTDEQ